MSNTGTRPWRSRRSRTVSFPFVNLFLRQQLRSFAAGRCEVEQNRFYRLCYLKPPILSNLLDYWKTARNYHLGTPMHHTIKTSKTSNTLKEEEGDLKAQNGPCPLPLSMEGIKSITGSAERALPRHKRRCSHRSCIGPRMWRMENKCTWSPGSSHFFRDRRQVCDSLTDSIQICPPDISLTWPCMIKQDT